MMGTIRDQKGVYEMTFTADQLLEGAVFSALIMLILALPGFA
jgi:hypothetical protein